jgi:hypothetical protein
MLLRKVFLCGSYIYRIRAKGRLIQALSLRIAWPFTGDQPANVAYMVFSLDVAFELTEVRSGDYGLMTMYHHGRAPKGTIEAFKEEIDALLGQLTDEVGQRKKANAKRIQRDLVDAWGEGGSATIAFNELLNRFEL